MSNPRDTNLSIEYDADGISLHDFEETTYRPPSIPDTNEQTSSTKHLISPGSPSCLQTSGDDLLYHEKDNSSPTDSPLKLQRHLFQNIAIALSHAALTIPFFVYGFIAWRSNSQPIPGQQIWIVRYGLGKKVRRMHAVMVSQLKAI